jgi:hypothetical protein
MAASTAATDSACMHRWWPRGQALWPKKEQGRHGRSVATTQVATWS